jgi:hypothetical protein
MTVNPNLATLMSLVEDLQDQMSEGKYLEAMNALRDLHRRPAAAAAEAPFQVPAGSIELTPAEWQLYIDAKSRRDIQHSSRPEVQKEYEASSRLREACDEANVTLHEWMAMEHSARRPIIRRALELRMKQENSHHPEVSPEVCPFIARHAIGRWGSPYTPNATWNCVCGSKNILSKNWKTHEQGDKHQEWHNGGRLVTKPKKTWMKANTGPETNTHKLLGSTISYESYGAKFALQTPNEWTHPAELGENNPHYHSFKEWKICEREPLAPITLTTNALPLYPPAVYSPAFPRLPTYFSHIRNRNGSYDHFNDNWIRMMTIGDHRLFLEMVFQEI